MGGREVVIAARKAKQLTQEQLAKVVGTTQAKISRIESGTTIPDAALAERLIRILDITLRDLVRTDDPVADSIPAVTTPRAAGGQS